MPTLAVLVGILVNNSRLGDLKSYMESRFTGIDSRFESERRVNEVHFKMILDKVEDIDARLTRLESRFARRIFRDTTGCMKSLLTLLTLVGALHGAVKLPSLISDHMVLQAGMPVRIWGTADPGEAVKVDFQGQSVATAARATASGRRGCVR